MTETDATRIAKESAYLVTERMATTIIRVIAFAFIARILTQIEMGVTVALTLTRAHPDSCKKVYLSEVISPKRCLGDYFKYMVRYIINV